MTQDLSPFALPELLEDDAAQSWGRRFARLAPTPPVLLYGGVMFVAAGFVLLAITWAQVADLLNVALQVPYLISGGLTGLALVMVGLLSVNISIRRADAAERAAESDRVVAALHELTSRLERLG